MVSDRSSVPRGVSLTRRLPSPSLTDRQLSRPSRVTHSVDRDVTMTSSFTTLTSSVAASRPSLPRRRYSVSAATAGTLRSSTTSPAIHRDYHDIDDYTAYHQDLPSASLPLSRSSSQFRWSRKGIIYTADNMRQQIVGTTSNSADVTRPVTSSRSTSVPRDDRSSAVWLRTRSLSRAASVSPRLDRPPVDHVSRSVRSSSVQSSRRNVIYTASSSQLQAVPSNPAILHYNSRDDDGLDLTAFVLSPGERFVPTDVEVSVLPSGQHAVTYSKFSQRGHGDQSQANAQIDRVVQRTKQLQDSMHTLETFVRNNRSLFPEDIIIYQHIVFYLLSEAELKRLGETRRGAEVYGVKIRERLVAPHGTDVKSILKRYYSRYDEVDVEYMEREDIQRQLRREMGDDDDTPGPTTGRRRKLESTDDVTVTRSRDRMTSSPDYEFYIKRQRSTSNDKRLEAGSKRAVTETPPVITARLQPKRVNEGESLRLNCSVEGNPDPDVTWYHDGQQIHNNGRYRITNTFGLCVLKLSDAKLSDAGLYQAKAVNSLGEVSTTADVTVHVNIAEPVVANDQLRRPTFIIDPRNSFAEVGQRAVFEAQAAGNPAPTFTWKKDNTDVVVDNRVRVVSDSNGNTKLVIRDVNTGDAGVYFCIAQNSEGKVKCAATLRVTNADDYSVPQYDRRSSDIYPGDQPPLCPVAVTGRWPQFLQVPPLHINVFEGDPLTLRCVIDGDPKPVVTWYKGVRELTYSERHRVLSEGNDQYMMQIRSTLQTDPGEYTAVAINSLGHAKFTVYVNVLPRPAATDEDDWSRRKPTELQQYDLVKNFEKGKMPPVFVVKLPREKTIKAGQTLEFKCHIEEAKMREYLVSVGIIPVPVDEKQSSAADDTVALVADDTRHDTVQDDTVPCPSIVVNGTVDGRMEDTRVDELAACGS